MVVQVVAVTPLLPRKLPQTKLPQTKLPQTKLLLTKPPLPRESLE